MSNTPVGATVEQIGWTPASIRLRVLSNLARLFTLPMEQIDPSASLETLGADSGDLIELHLMLLEEFDVDLEEATRELSESPSVDSVVAMIAERVIAS